MPADRGLSSSRRLPVDRGHAFLRERARKRLGRGRRAEPIDLVSSGREEDGPPRSRSRAPARARSSRGRRPAARRRRRRGSRLWRPRARRAEAARWPRSRTPWKQGRWPTGDAWPCITPVSAPGRRGFRASDTLRNMEAVAASGEREPTRRRVSEGSGTGRSRVVERRAVVDALADEARRATRRGLRATRWIALRSTAARAGSEREATWNGRRRRGPWARAPRREVVVGPEDVARGGGKRSGSPVPFTLQSGVWALPRLRNRPVSSDGYALRFPLARTPSNDLHERERKGSGLHGDLRRVGRTPTSGSTRPRAAPSTQRRSPPSKRSRGAGPSSSDRVRSASRAFRLATPEDIADAVSLLCRDEARFVTGQNLVVNGGA